MELSSVEMDGESCCFIWATSPFFLLRLLLLQRLFLPLMWITFCQSILFLIPYLIHIFSSFLSFSLPFFPRYSLTLILLWALVNSVWFTCFDFFLLCFPLPAHSIFLSTEDTSHKVVIPVFAALSNYAFAHAISGGTGFRAWGHTNSRLKNEHQQE